jgi:serine/threonine protein kinase
MADSTTTSIILPRPIEGATTDDGTKEPENYQPLSNKSEIDNEYEVANSLITFVQTVYTLDVPMDVRLESVNHYHILGEGASFIVRRDFRFGQVLTVPSRMSEVEGVLKVSRQGFSSGFAKKFKRTAFVTLMRELSVLGHQKLRKHPNIINLQKVGWGVTALSPLEICPVLYVERAPHGTLSEFEKSGTVLDIVSKQRLCLDICRGVEALHKHGIVHGDIKAQNVLIFGDAENGFVAKLSDFGCSIILDTYSKSDENDKVRMPGLSPPWNAPEALDDGLTISQLPQTDLYSLGLLIWRILVFHDPFSIFDLPLNPAIRKQKIREILTLPHFPALVVHFITDPHPHMNRQERDLYANIFSTALSFEPSKRDLDTITSSLQLLISGPEAPAGKLSIAETPDKDTEFLKVPALPVTLNRVSTITF